MKNLVTSIFVASLLAAGSAHAMNVTVKAGTQLKDTTECDEPGCNYSYSTEDVTTPSGFECSLTLMVPELVKTDGKVAVLLNEFSARLKQSDSRVELGEKDTCVQYSAKDPKLCTLLKKDYFYTRQFSYSPMNNVYSVSVGCGKEFADKLEPMTTAETDALLMSVRIPGVEFSE